MARSTTYGFWRQRGGKGTPAPLPAALAFSFDPTAAAGTGTGKKLPAGARVVEVLINGAATGGASPTVNIGYVGGDADALVTGAAADAVSRTLVVGAPLAAATEVSANVGASAATGGTVEAIIVFVMDDDGTE